MINAIFEFILVLTASLLSIILTPINAIISAIFPDFSNWIQTFNNFLTNDLFNNVSWFLNFIPPMTRSFIIAMLGFLVLLLNSYIIYFTIYTFVNLFRKLKP